MQHKGASASPTGPLGTSPEPASSLGRTASVPCAKLEAAARAVAQAAFTIYREEDGSPASIEDDYGEKCFIVPHDEMIELRAALDSLRTSEA